METEKLNELRRIIRAEQDDSATLETAPPMLDIRTLKKGWLALPYDSLRRVEFNPDGKPPLRVHFSSHILELQGRNLQTVYRALASKRLGQLREVGERHDTGQKDDAVVHVLTIVDKGVDKGVDEEDTDTKSVPTKAASGQEPNTGRRGPKP